MKYCKFCDSWKQRDEFRKHKAYKDGFGNICRKCHHAKNQKYKKTPEKARLDTNNYIKRHPERVKENARIWRNKNRDKILRQRKKRRTTEKYKKTAREYAIRTADKRKEWLKKWRKNMPLKTKLRINLRNRFAKIIIRLKRGKKYNSASRVIGCTIEELREHLEKQFKQGMCWDNYGSGKDKWNIDHIIPISKFNLFDMEEQNKAFHYTNLQPLWSYENFSKGNRMNIIWAFKVNPCFLTKLLRICANLRIDPDFLMACIAFETGETFSPSVKNKSSGATGLIQFMPQTASALGTSVQELGEMSAEDQLDYVEKYFSPWKGRLQTLEDIYMAILFPKAIGKPNSYILFAKNDLKYPKRYIQNRGLDYNNDGYITKEEASNKVREKFIKGQELTNV